MALDPSRASFVSQQYRYEIITDAPVSAIFPASQILTIETNLTEASAVTLADQLAEEATEAAKVVSFVIEGAISPDTFAGGVPRFIVEAPSLNISGRVMKLTSMKVDHNTGRTEVTVRG